MHKLMEYVCDEIDELEKKIGKGENLSAAEVEYADKLVSIKKNILRTEDLANGGYSEMTYYGNGRMNSYGRRYPRRDARGRYSSAGKAEDMLEQLESLKENAPDQIKSDLDKLIRKVESM